MIKEEVSFIVSSDPEAGAINRNVDGNQFEVQLDEPLSLPKDAVNVNLSVQEATVWWVVPNIIEGVNDKIYIFGDDDQAIPVPQLFTVTVPQGLYSGPELNTAILSGLEQLGARTNPSPLINLGEDSATQRVIIRFNYTNVTVDFTQSDTFRDIIGFDALVYGPFALAPVNELAPNVAAFNQINYFLLTSDLVQKGLRFNNTYSQIISQVLIDVAPGSQIVSRPFNPAKTGAQQLAGSRRTNIRFRLTDDRLRDVNTNGEFFSMRIVITYMRPFVIERTR
jgi:hypothetical protein